MTFFTYKQNNSGGVLTQSEELAEYVIIEATSQEEAESKALSIGIYFDGVEEGEDCECCGDRWSRDEKGAISATIYGNSPEHASPFDNQSNQPYCIVYFLSGAVARYYLKEVKE